MNPVPPAGTMYGTESRGCRRKKNSKPPPAGRGRWCWRVASMITTAGVTASAMFTKASLRSSAGRTAASDTRGPVCTTSAVPDSTKPNWEAIPSPNRKQAATERATFVFALSGSYIVDFSCHKFTLPGVLATAIATRRATAAVARRRTGGRPAAREHARVPPPTATAPPRRSRSRPRPRPHRLPPRPPRPRLRRRRRPPRILSRLRPPAPGIPPGPRR